MSENLQEREATLIGELREEDRAIQADEERLARDESCRAETLTEFEDLERKHRFEIVVNTRPKVVYSREVSYHEIVKLAFENPTTDPNVIFTITYRDGPRENPEGTLAKGQTVKVKDCMIFNVTRTDRS